MDRWQEGEALDTSTITVFVDRATTDLATNTPVGSALTSPDNLAIDNDGNVYIVEDRNGGVDDDIWFARDRNHDGDHGSPSMS
jgi:secreted PhoX family phosphatase